MSRYRGVKPSFQKKTNDTNSDPTSIHPSILKQGRKSGSLNLSGRNLTSVPSSVWRINIDAPEESKTVSLDDSEDRWWDQVELTKLILASNCLTEISDDITLLPALTVLDIHDNKLTTLPDVLDKLENLQKLDVSHNNLKVLPQSVTKLRNLLSLQIGHNDIEELHEQLGYISSLEDLDISNNVLCSLPKSVGYLIHVTRLNVSNNKISSLPPELGCMDNLRYLDANHNQLVSIPPDLGRLSKLEQLYLRHNKLSSLPVLQDCKNVKELHLGNNTITALTAEQLEHLSMISVLDIRDNKIDMLPDEIILLEGLQRLDLTNNNLTGLPFGLGAIDSLKSIVLDGNPMKSIRRDIIMRGTVALKKYLVSRMEEPLPTTPAGKGAKPPSQQDTPMFGGGDSPKAHDMYQQKTLDFSNKQCSSVTEDVFEEAVKANVKIVNLSKNVLTDLPEGLSMLTDTLTELNLGLNKFAALSPQISSYQSLVFLDLRNNLLVDLPSELSKLMQLREIILSYNRFTSVPSVIYDLKKLEILFMDNNQVDNICVNGLQKLPTLATLDLQNNNIAQVPPELGNCTNLQSLQLRGNGIRNPRPAILEKGTAALLEYLRGRIVS